MTPNTTAMNQEPVSESESKGLRRFIEKEFPYIRKASITLALCLSVSLGMIMGSNYLLVMLEMERDEIGAASSQATEKLREAELEKIEIRDFQPKYLNLQNLGFIGEERRLAWIETINRIQEKHKLLPITYEISAQSPVHMESSIQTGGLELRASKMQLKMDLLHEGDLLNFLDELKKDAFYTVRDCTVVRAGIRNSEPLEPRLEADCALYWLTMGSGNATASGAAATP